ncbi:MAG TPA: zf-HC2 domain-containing protein [Ktedonobacterales bacterium]|nr:zf-HC2 domain-containing protein [Ktedonobacterales bacterium]
MNHQPAPSPMLAPECAVYEPLLPLAANRLLDGAQTADVQAHLATSARCRAALAEHEDVDTALRRAFAAPPAARMPFTPEQLLALTQPTTRSVGATLCSGGRSWPGGRPRASRRLLAGMPAIAAVLLLALLARYIFTQGSRGGGAVATPTSPAAVLPPNLDIKSIAVFGNEAEWAVGATVPDPACRSGGCGIGPTPHPYMQPVMLFLQAGHWEKLLTLPALHRPDYNWELNSIALVSPTEGWAVGARQYATPSGASGSNPANARILHYHDGVWQQQASFTAPAGVGFFTLNAIAMSSADDGWAAGTGGMLVHYTGGHWSLVSSPTTHDLNAIALPPGGSGWAMGSPTTLLQFTGDRWSTDLTTPTTP